MSDSQLSLIYNIVAEVQVSIPPALLTLGYDV